MPAVHPSLGLVSCTLRVSPQEKIDRQDSEFTGTMLTRSISMLILRVSMVPKSRMIVADLWFSERSKSQIADDIYRWKHQ